MRIFSSLFAIFTAVFFLTSNYIQAGGLLPFKAAALAFNPQMMQFDSNVRGAAKAAEMTSEEGAKLIVMPETAISGYMYDNLDEIKPYLDTIPGKTTAALSEVTKKYHNYIAIGIAEYEPETGLAYNAAALVGPEGYIGKYRKTGLNAQDTRMFTGGNLGFPVFKTELGNIGLVICYDDTYLQSLMLPSLRGADIIAFVTCADKLPFGDPGFKNNHETVAAIASLSGWFGTYIVCSGRTGNETNPITGASTRYVGGMGIWDPFGNQIAMGDVNTQSISADIMANPAPSAVYADIKPASFNNCVKAYWLENRRPELYSVLSLYRLPLDPDASSVSLPVKALCLQFEPKLLDAKANLGKIKEMIKSTPSDFNIVVLPENALIGGSFDAETMKKNALSESSPLIEEISQLAQKYNTYVVFSYPEADGDKYYQSVLLINNHGAITGKYRKCHLNEKERKWAVPGSEIAVFKTLVGRVGLISGDEVRIPEFADVMAVKRADIIAIPSSWDKSYSNNVQINPKLLTKSYPSNTNLMWFYMAKFSQAYVLAANFTGSSLNYTGSSGFYSLNPIEGLFPPALAGETDETAFSASFSTLADPSSWISQQSLLIGRRADMAVPLTLDMNSGKFKEWIDNKTK